MKKFIIALLLAVIAMLLLGLLVPTIRRERPAPREFVYVGAIHAALLAYYNDYGRYPDGAPAEVARSFTGSSPRNIMYLELSAFRTNRLGELCDFWDTPYTIDLSGPRPKVISAGPDRKAGTPDDTRKE